MHVITCVCVFGLVGGHAGLYNCHSERHHLYDRTSICRHAAAGFRPGLIGPNVGLQQLSIASLSGRVKACHGAHAPHTAHTWHLLSHIDCQQQQHEYVHLEPPAVYVPPATLVQRHQLESFLLPS